MKFPDDVRAILLRKFKRDHQDWLRCQICKNHETVHAWPREISLDVPSEAEFIGHLDTVDQWTAAWQKWRGAGELVWCQRSWCRMGTHKFPEKILMHSAADVAAAVGESIRWNRCLQRFSELVDRWPNLGHDLPKHYKAVGDYEEADFKRLLLLLAWVHANPRSQLYPRQLPIAGLDSKWVESRSGLVTSLVAALLQDGAGDFYTTCGLRPLPCLVRMRILDPALRERVGGLSDISLPAEDLASLRLPVRNVLIVENLQTGLAFDDIPGTVVLMRLGYAVDVLGRIPWLASATLMYWGDLDTHGFAILDHVRSHLPGIKSILMDEMTLLCNKELWTEENQQHSALFLARLSPPELALYRSLKQNTFGSKVRLEQERISWAAVVEAFRCHALSV